jgi:lipopolysaccharide export system permease protein
LLTNSEGRRQEKMAVLFHTRLTRPLVGALLVLLGVSVILWNPQRHVVLSAGLCVVIGAGFYVCVVGCKALGDAEYITPPLAAWLPVLLYGPIAIVAYDAMHT